MTFFYLRIACLAVWLAAAIVLAPSAWRYFTKFSQETTEYRLGLFFTSLLFAGSLARWIIAPDENDVFLALTAMTLALGVYVLILSLQGRRK